MYHNVAPVFDRQACSGNNTHIREQFPSRSTLVVYPRRIKLETSLLHLVEAFLGRLLGLIRHLGVLQRAAPRSLASVVVSRRRHPEAATTYALSPPATFPGFLSPESSVDGETCLYSVSVGSCLRKGKLTVSTVVLALEDLLGVLLGLVRGMRVG